MQRIWNCKFYCQLKLIAKQVSTNGLSTFLCKLGLQIIFFLNIHRECALKRFNAFDFIWIFCSCVCIIGKSLISFESLTKRILCTTFWNIQYLCTVSKLWMFIKSIKINWLNLCVYMNVYNQASVIQLSNCYLLAHVHYFSGRVYLALLSGDYY